MGTFADRLNRDSLSALWDKFNWHDAENELRVMQGKIAAAAQCKQSEMVTAMQHELVNSLTSHMLAVRHAASATSGPGVDGVRWTHSYQKMKAALTLGQGEYKASPCRLLVVQPKKGKERSVKLSTMYDRAMQTLYAYALTPVAETLGDRKSFAFRPYRSAMDAHYFVSKIFTGTSAPEYLVKADVRACYESISHKWLLKNIPMDRNILKEFLSAGHVFDGELFPPMEFGISIGSSISPVLANMTLDGLQDAIYKGLHNSSGVMDFDNGNMVRFADDIVVSARSAKDARKILQIMSKFLRVRGLSLSPAKTKVLSAKDGFEFLSKNYQMLDDIMFATPCESSVAKFEQALSEFILGFRGSQLTLIEELNRKLNGWATYHKFTDATDAFRRIDTAVYVLLLELCRLRHKFSPLENIIEKYFVRDADGERIYTMKNKKDVRVIRLSKIPLVVHKPISLSRNPFQTPEYFTEIAKEREIAYATGKYRAIWTRQDGRCYFCGSSILPDQTKTIAVLDESKPAHGSNIAYVHSRCAASGADFYKTSEYFPYSSDVLRIVERIAAKDVYTEGRNRFYALKTFLWRQTKPTIILKFSEIEQLVGFKLPPQRESVFWWKQHWAGSVGTVGRETGYRIAKVNVKRRTVTFKRDELLSATVKIPDVFLSGKIPADAATELVGFFEYLRKKYGF